jgi:hypothetical protein
MGTPHRFRTAATILAGLAAGAVASVAVSELRDRHRADPAASVSPVEVRPALDPMERARQMMTEARLHALEAAARQPDREREPERPPSPNAATDEAAHPADTRAYHEARVAEHGREALDRTWAAKTEGLVGKALGASSAAHRFQTVALDCRSVTCAATLEWPSYGDALGTMEDLLHGPFVPCGRQVVMPEPTDPAARYQTTVLYHDCDRHPR